MVQCVGIVEIIRDIEIGPTVDIEIPPGCRKPVARIAADANGTGHVDEMRRAVFAGVVA